MYILSFENGVAVALPVTYAEDVGVSAVQRCEQVELGANVVEMTTYHVVGTVRWHGDRYVYTPTRTH